MEEEITHDILDHAEGDDVAGEAGIFDFLQFDQDFVGSWHL